MGQRRAAPGDVQNEDRSIRNLRPRSPRSLFTALLHVNVSKYIPPADASVVRAAFFKNGGFTGPPWLY
jgi:hypothetical protein